MKIYPRKVDEICNNGHTLSEYFGISSTSLDSTISGIGCNCDVVSSPLFSLDVLRTTGGSLTSTKQKLNKFEIAKNKQSYLKHFGVMTDYYEIVMRFTMQEKQEIGQYSVRFWNI